MLLGWAVVIILFTTFGLVVFIGAPYVPSKKRQLDRAFTELYPLSGSDLLVDIGSGDGVVLRAAARTGAKAVGYEINPFLVAISTWLSRSDKNVSTRCQNFWRSELPADVTIVYTFGDSRDIEKMARLVQRTATRVKRPVYLMSLGFKLKDMKIHKHQDPYVLYKFYPLQPQEA